MKSWEISSMAAVAEARRVMNPPETERSRTLSIGLAKASKDDRRTIVGLLLLLLLLWQGWSLFCLTVDSYQA